MLMSNICICPHCHSQNISTMVDDRRRVVRVMCGNCREFTDYDMDECLNDVMKRMETGTVKDCIF